MRIVLVAMVALLALPVMAGEFVVESAYIRGLPPGQTVTAAFMSLHNGLDRECHLVGASTPIAASAEVHAHSHHGGTMSMRPVASLPVPAGGQVSLQPGGYHLMLFGLRETLVAGERHPLILKFEDCPDIELNVPVRSVLAED